MARTSIWVAPEPKLASTAGAYWVAAGSEVTTTVAPCGAGAPGVSGMSRAAVTPRACSAVHRAGSQPMIALLLSWPAIHAAAAACTGLGWATTGRAALCWVTLGRAVARAGEGG